MQSSEVKAAKKSTRASSKEDVGAGVTSEGENATVFLKDLHTVVELSVKKALDLFRDEFLKLLDERLDLFAARLTAVEATQAKHATCIRDLERGLNDIVERSLSLETKMATTEKTVEDSVQSIDTSSSAQLQTQIHDCMVMTNDLEQYGRRYNIRLHGLTLSGESSTDAVVDIIRDKLHLECTTDDIEASHPLPSRSSEKQPAVIVRFRSRKKRDEVLRSRKNLKGTNVSISEDLTSLNMQLLNRLKKSDKIKSCWTWNGRVFGIGTESGNKCLFKPFCSIEETLTAG